MIALIDGDLVLYRCAASAENDPFEIAKSRVNELLDQILVAIGATEYRFFLSGKRTSGKQSTLNIKPTAPNLNQYTFLH